MPKLRIFSGRHRPGSAVGAGSFRQALRSGVGAIDLASIMVGVIVIGLFASVIAATVFAVIPWSQVQAAKGNLDAVRTAEAVAFVKDSRYMNTAELVTAGYLNAPAGMVLADGIGGGRGFSVRAPADFVPKTLSVATNAAGSCFVAVARAANGDIFYVSSAVAGIHDYDAATADTVVSAGSCTSVVATVQSLGASGAPVSVTSTSLANAAAYTAYSYQVASAGDGTLTLSASGLPAGLTMSASGLVTGMPTAVGRFTVVITAANEAVSASLTMVMDVVGQTTFSETFTDSNIAARGVTVGGGTTVYGIASNYPFTDSTFGAYGGEFRVSHWVQEYSTAYTTGARINLVIHGLVPNHAYVFSANSTNNIGGQVWVGNASLPATGTTLYTWTSTTDASGSYTLHASVENQWPVYSTSYLTLSHLHADIVP